MAAGLSRRYDPPVTRIALTIAFACIAACATTAPSGPYGPPSRAELVALAAAEVSRGPSPIGEEILGTGGEDVLPWIEELARSEDPAVRLRARSLLLSSTGAPGMPAAERVNVILHDLCRDDAGSGTALLALARLRDLGPDAVLPLRLAAAGSGDEATVARRLLQRLGVTP